MDLMYTAQLFGNLGEFVGAIAVVATLFYLALQVRHGKEATEANTASLAESRKLSLSDSYMRRTDVMERSLTQLALSEEMSAISVKARQGQLGDLSDVERFRLEMWERARMVRVDSQFYQWQQGFLDDEYYENQFKFVVSTFGPLWSALDLRFERPSLRAEVARILAK